MTKNERQLRSEGDAAFEEIVPLATAEIAWGGGTTGTLGAEQANWWLLPAITTVPPIGFGSAD